MGNVIRPNFGGRKIESEPVEQVAPATESEKILQEAQRFATDVQFYVKNKDVIIVAYRQGEAMTNYVFDVLGVTKKDESVELRRGVVAQYSLEMLATRLADSNPIDWRKEPHFYGATYLELDARRRAVEHILDQLEKRVAQQDDTS